jgi:hypothetical protein
MAAAPNIRTLIEDAMAMQPEIEVKVYQKSEYNIIIETNDNKYFSVPRDLILNSYSPVIVKKFLDKLNIPNHEMMTVEQSGRWFEPVKHIIFDDAELSKKENQRDVLVRIDANAEYTQNYIKYLETNADR